MTIEKLPSGNYRVVQMVNGTRYRATFDHKPSKIEAMKVISKMTERPTPTNSTVLSACGAYIESKINVLSPASIRQYNGIVRQISPNFGNKYLKAVTHSDIQAEVNRYSKGKAPKTVKDFAHFIVGVFNFYDVDIKCPTLPQAVKKKKYLPTTEDAKRIVQYYKGTQYEVYFRLALYGLRRSEILALQLSDLDVNLLTIDKALVQDANKEWVVKTTKTTDSTRTIVIDDELASLIQEQGYVFKGFPNMPYKHLQVAQKALGIPQFPLHAFRHLTASFLHNIGYSDKQIEKIGGWKTDYVMKAVYQEAMEMEEAKKNTSIDIAGILK